MATEIETNILNTVIAVVVNAYETGTLHSQHRALGSSMRATPEGQRIQNLKEAFKELAKFPHRANPETGYPGWGRLGDFNVRDVVNDIAYLIVRRAAASIDALCTQAQNSRLSNGGAIPIAEIKGSKQNYVTQDADMVTTLLDTDGVWISPKVLQRYLGGLEEYHSLMGFNPDINRLCRRLTGLTKKFVQSFAQPQTPAPRVKTEEEKNSIQAQADTAVAESAKALSDNETTDQQIEQHRADIRRELVEKADRKAEAETVRIEHQDPKDASTRIILDNRRASELSASAPLTEYTRGESHE